MAILTERYSRNNLYVEPATQARLASTRLFFAGLGLASYAVECCLRLGFERIHMVDGDTVSLSNLNRQNFCSDDIGASKVDVALSRLRSIHPEAQISGASVMLDESSIANHVEAADFVVNTLDYDDGYFLACNRVAREHGKTVVFPSNFGFGTACYVFHPDSPTLEDALAGSEHPPSLAISAMIFARLHERGALSPWMGRALERYVAEPPHHEPQLSIGSFLTAGLVASVLFQLVEGEQVPTFPQAVMLDGRPSRVAEGL